MGVEGDAKRAATSFVREDTRPVLVAVDGSTGAWDALEWAAAEAAARDCPLRIVHALTWPLMFDPFGAVWTYRDDAADEEAAVLLLIQAELRAREVAHDLRVTTHLQVGSTDATVLSHEHDSSLIVLDRGHSRGLGGALAGSPAARVARHADCPIAVIGSAQERPCGPCPTRVVVGLNGTGDRISLLGFAFRAARRRGVGVTALHASAPHDHPLETNGWTADATKRRYVNDVLAPWRAAFPEVDVAQRLVNASPDRALVDESAGAALLVIGGSRSGRLSRSLLGSLYFQNKHDGTFVEQAIERGVALSEDGMEQAGMGVAVGDFMLDGNLHIVKTHFAADTPAVYVNNGKGEFKDQTLRSGLGVETRFISWGIGIEDLDNDGAPDIFWVTGGIYPELRKQPGQPYDVPRLLFRNLGKGRFEELSGQAGPGVDARHCSRGCAFGDFDNDGDLDILIVNQNEPPSLLRNDVSGNAHWLKFKLTGVKSNRSAIGARVTVHYGGKVQAKEVLSQSSYLSANDSRLHFGLGAATVADVEIRWPLGQLEKLANVPADRLIHVTEGQGIKRSQKLT